MGGNGMSLSTMRRAFHLTMDNIDHASRYLKNLSIQINKTESIMADRQAELAREMFPAATVRKVEALSDRAGLLHDAGALSNRADIDRLPFRQIPRSSAATILSRVLTAAISAGFM